MPSLLKDIVAKVSAVTDELPELWSPSEDRDEDNDEDNEDDENENSSHKQRIFRAILLVRNEICSIVIDLLSIRRTIPETDTDTDTDGIRVYQNVVATVLDPFFAAVTALLDAGCEKKKNTGVFGGATPGDSEIRLLRNGMTPLQIACDKGDPVILRYFRTVLETEAAIANNNNNNNHNRPFRGRWASASVLECLIGNPISSVSVSGGNPVVHHATTKAAIEALVGVAEPGGSVLELLERILLVQNRLRGTAAEATAFAAEATAGNDPGGTILAFAAATNHHGDTLLMMATAHNFYIPESADATTDPRGASSAAIFLEHWYSLALRRESGGGGDDDDDDNNDNNDDDDDDDERRRRLRQRRRAIRDVLVARNDSGETVLSYAVSKGLFEVIRWLIRLDREAGCDGFEESSCIIPSDASAQIQGALDEFNRKAGRLTGQRPRSGHPEITRGTHDRIGEEINEKIGVLRTAMEESAGLIEAHTRWRSERVARELILSEELEDNTKTLDHQVKRNNTDNRSAKTKPRKKKKKRKKKQQQDQLQDQQVQPQEQEPEQQNPPEQNEEQEERPSKQTPEPKTPGDEDGEASESHDPVAEAAATAAREEEPRSPSTTGNGDGTNAVSGTALGSGSCNASNGDALPLTKLASGRPTVAVAVAKHDDDDDDDSSSSSSSSSSRFGEAEEPDLPVILPSVLHRKLASGRLAVADANHDGISPSSSRSGEAEKPDSPVVLPPIPHRKRTLSLDETNRLLRDRYRQGNAPSSLSLLPSRGGASPGAAAAAGRAMGPSSSLSDADAVLSALCLDVSCLLYSDHGMALNLSPAQLDAVERILRGQLRSVAAARALQERRCRAGATADADPRSGP